MDFLARHDSPDVISARLDAIRQQILRDSPRIRQPQFQSINHEDVAQLFRLYDEHFFHARLGSTVTEQTGTPLSFRVSTTMTRAGGKTIRTRTRPRKWLGGINTHYEIAIAGRLLFMTFDDIQRPVVVCGLACTDRLQAMQRIMEHEIIHLYEFLTWGNSACGRKRFKGLVKEIFGHADTKHDLVTPRERAAVRHGINVGSLVEFDFQGQKMAGRVNRIHHRATVLVESPVGTRYTNGKRYQKYYIPLTGLKVAQMV